MLGFESRTYCISGWLNKPTQLNSGLFSNYPVSLDPCSSIWIKTQGKWLQMLGFESRTCCISGWLNKPTELNSEFFSNYPVSLYGSRHRENGCICWDSNPKPTEYRGGNCYILVSLITYIQENWLWMLGFESRTCFTSQIICFRQKKLRKKLLQMLRFESRTG